MKGISVLGRVWQRGGRGCSPFCGIGGKYVVVVVVKVVVVVVELIELERGMKKKCVVRP
jgi:hypothetical protein